MSRVHDPARSDDPAIRTAVDGALAGAPPDLLLRGIFDRLAQALRADHPDDWERRLDALSQLIQRAEAIWAPPTGGQSLEYVLRIVLDALLATGFALRPPTLPPEAAKILASFSTTPSGESQPGQDRVAALAAAQGVRPVVLLSDLASHAWPEDETADEFQAAVQAWRRGA